MIELTPLFGPKDAPGEKAAFRVFPPTGTERWLLEARFRRPWHLETWPRANRRAQVIYRVARLMGRVGLHLPHRRVVLSVAQGSAYDKLRARFEALAVFLGTPGPNRKFVVFAKDGAQTWFIKVPISEGSAALARTEAAALDTLAGDDDMAPLVPRHFWIGDALALEDVRPAGASFSTLARDEIIRVHALLFARSRTEVSVRDLAAAWPRPSLAAPPPHLDQDTRALIDATREAAQAHLARLDPGRAVECYLAHGDFTRWNVLRARDGTARIIDWELYGRQPKFFDPFHYIVSQAILVDREPASTILDRIVAFGSGLADRSFILFYFGLYLSEQALVHCDLYTRGDEVFPQVHWHLRTWTELFELLSSDRQQGAATPADSPVLPPKAAQ